MSKVTHEYGFANVMTRIIAVAKNEQEPNKQSVDITLADYDYPENQGIWIGHYYTSNLDINSREKVLAFVKYIMAYEANLLNSNEE